MTYSTIVAGIADITADSAVLDRACEAAVLHDAALLIVACFDPVTARNRARVTKSAPDIRFNETVLSEAEAYELAEEARDLASERGVSLVQGVVVEGRAGAALTLVALDTDADLIVVGSHGVDTLSGRLFGAVSVRIMRKAHCDILVVVDRDSGPGAEDED